MIVYQTNHEGVYVGPVQADPSPLEPDEWLVPGGCVTVEPPALAEGERARWDNGNWIILSPPEPDLEPEEPEPQPITRIERRQGLRALLGDGTTPGITRAMLVGMIEAIPDQVEREIALAEYEHTHWVIDSPFITVGAAHFGMSSEQVQALFDHAATL
jgi:hypothetical protein